MRRSVSVKHAQQRFSIQLTFLIKGVMVDWDVMRVKMMNRRLATTFHPAIIYGDDPHIIIVLKLLDCGDEKWVIDTTGCQHGRTEVLVPYPRYQRETQFEQDGPLMPYFGTPTEDLDRLDRTPAANRTPAQAQQRALERQARQHFAVFVEERFRIMSTKGPNDAFEEFLLGLETDLRAHMRRLFAT